MSNKKSTGEARVWSFLSKVVKTDYDFESRYLDYALGVSPKNRMPWSLPVKKKLRPQDLMEFMRDHFQGTKLNMTSDVGAGNWLAEYFSSSFTGLCCWLVLSFVFVFVFDRERVRRERHTVLARSVVLCGDSKGGPRAAEIPLSMIHPKGTATGP